MCIRCELPQKFGWIHDVGAEERGSGVAVHLYHSYPPGIDIEDAVQKSMRERAPIGVTIDIRSTVVTPQEGIRLEAKRAEEIAEMEAKQAEQGDDRSQYLTDMLNRLIGGRS